MEESYRTEPGKENVPGAGGTYTYRVKGVKPGNADFYMAYARSWEDEVPLEARHYRLFVDSDLKITLIDEGSVDPSLIGKPVDDPDHRQASDSSEQKDDVLEISLDGNPTTGFVWTAEADPEWVVEIDESYESDSNDMALSGVGGTYTYLVTGSEPGEATLTFTYARPWESVEPWRTEQYTILVGDDLSITVLDHQSLPAK